MSQLDLSALTVPGSIRVDTLSATPYRVRHIVRPTALSGGRCDGLGGVVLSIRPRPTDMRLLSADDATAEDADGTAIAHYATLPAGVWTEIFIPEGGSAYRSVLSSTASQVYEAEVNRPGAL